MLFLILRYHLFILFIYFWLCWVSIAAHRFSLVAMSRDHSAVEMHGLLVVVASLVAEHKALEHVGFGSCGARA